LQEFATKSPVSTDFAANAFMAKDFATKSFVPKVKRGICTAEQPTQGARQWAHHTQPKPTRRPANTTFSLPFFPYALQKGERKRTI